jgi:tetratricopeptide (TPR) repeat protein
MPLARWIPLLLLLAIAAAYCELPSHDFINLDDPIYVLENPNLRQPLGPASVARAFRPYEHNWIPLTWLSLHLDYALHGPNAAGFLVTNALLHALAAVLLFLALARMTSAPGPSAFVAGVFALHPAHVESVAWVAERKDVLSAVCFAAALLVYAGGQDAGRRAVVALWLALGLLAKPMLVTLPFVLLLLDWWPLGRLGEPGEAPEPRALRAAVWEKLPLFALVIAASAVAFYVQQTTGAVAPLDRVPVSARFANAATSTLWYVVASVWPSGLAAFYPLPAQPAWGAALACAAVLVAVSALALRHARRAPYAAVGWLWFLGMLVPVAGFVQVGLQARADRYLYLPQIGLALALAFAACDLSRARPALRRLLPAAALASLAALGVATFFQVRHWRDSERLWTRALAVTERNFVAERALGDTLVEHGRAPEALPHYREAARLRPGWPEAELGLADVYAATGEVERALSVYRDRLRRAPQDARATGALGLALLRVGRMDEARTTLEAAQRLAPEKAEVLAGLGVVNQQQGRAREAIAAYREAVRRAPGLATAANNLAWLLATHPDPALRSPAEAVALAERALEASPRPDPALLDTLAAAYASAGRFAEASARAEEAARLAAGAAPELSRAISERAALYRAGRAYVENP